MILKSLFLVWEKPSLACMSLTIFLISAIGFPCSLRRISVYFSRIRSEIISLVHRHHGQRQVMLFQTRLRSSLGAERGRLWERGRL